MAIVMPRSRSSGALSIWSKAIYLLLALALASTLVMAAVRVVLPWSMCPIVPTFTCGFVRSNFFFAICFQSHIVCFNPDWALLANVTGRISIPYGNELFFCFNFQSHMGVA